MLTINRKTLCLLLVLICQSLFSMGQPKALLSATPSWLLSRNPELRKAPKDRDITDGYFFMLFDEQVNVSQQTRYQHTIKKIVNENGVQAGSEITINFSGDFQKLYMHTLSILRDGKTINKLDVSKIKIEHEQTDAYDHLYQGEYQALIILNDVRKGDQVELAYSVKGENPVFRNKFCDRFTFAANTNITNHYSSIIIPSERKLVYKCFNNAPKPIVTQCAGCTVYDFPVLNLEPFTTTSTSPSWYSSYPFVEMSEFSTWKEFAGWAADIMSYPAASLPTGLKNKMSEWSKQSRGDDALFAEKAARFVQDDIRYQGIEIGEYTHRPHSPAETFNNRYGDCKDKSILLATILRSHNIKAYMVLVNTELRSHLTEHIPGHDKFDHAIVKTVLNGKNLWIDPTYSMQRGSIASNYLPIYGKGLVIDKETAAPEDIILNRFGKIEVTETYLVPEAKDESGELKVSTMFYSGQADDMRRTLSDGIKSLEKSYEKYYTDQLGQTKLNGAISVDDDTVENKITIGETYTVNRVWKGDGKEQELEVFAKPISDRLPRPDKNAPTAPLALDYPLDLKYTMVLDMPSRFTLAADNLEFKTPSYAYSFKWGNVGNKLLLIYTLKSFKDHIPGNEVAQYKEDYDKIFNTLDYTFTYNAARSSSHNNHAVSIINWVAVLIFAMGLVILGLLFRIFNRAESALTSHTRMPQHLSGWPVLLAMFLCLSILVNLVSLASSSYFSMATWKQLASSGGSAILLLFMLDMLYNITVISFSGALLYWYAHKRDIFPKMFIALGILQLAMNLFTLAVGYMFSSQIKPYYPEYSRNSAAGVIFCVIFLGVWATALLKSPKTAKLFITPYRYRSVRQSTPFETLEAAREELAERD